MVVGRKGGPLAEVKVAAEAGHSSPITFLELGAFLGMIGSLSQFVEQPSIRFLRVRTYYVTKPLPRNSLGTL